MKEADAARALWAKLRKSIGEDAENLCVMRKHHMHPHGPNLVDMLEKRGQRYGTVIDIGTAQAVSAVLLAQFCEFVVTIDVVQRPLTERVIKESGVGDRVVRCLIANDAAKAQLLKRLTFDMAFIDGAHEAPNFKIDFDLCKRCGLLLCHDYPTWKPNAAGCAVILDAQKEGNLAADPAFVWWEKGPPALTKMDRAFRGPP